MANCTFSSPHYVLMPIKNKQSYTSKPKCLLYPLQGYKGSKGDMGMPGASGDKGATGLPGLPVRM